MCSRDLRRAEREGKLELAQEPDLLGRSEHIGHTQRGQAVQLAQRAQPQRSRRGRTGLRDLQRPGFVEHQGNAGAFQPLAFAVREHRSSRVVGACHVEQPGARADRCQQR